MVSIASHIQQILDEHNRKRNELAGGKIYGFNSAARMPTMVSKQKILLIANVNFSAVAMGS